MAPFKHVSTALLVLIAVHILVLEAALDEERGAACPSRCTCLGALVDCSRKGLDDVPSDLPHWTRILDLSSNQLQILNSSAFQNLGSLQKLILNHNHLVEFPVLDKGSNLTLLSLQHNEIHSLNVSILEELPRLQILDLSFNHLVDLPANTFGRSHSLLHLTLSHNRLVGLERGLLDQLTALESLKLSKNRLPALPKELFRHLASLQHLELNSLGMTQVEGLSFQGLGALVVLKMRHSGIAALQDGAFYGLSGIRKLQLDYNNIGKVTKGWLYGLNSLQRLYINNNNISEIEDDAWDSGRRLLELDLSHNQLPSISAKSLDRLHALRRLLLSHNRIAYIEEDAFRPLSALQYLDLQHNDVSWTLEDSGGRTFAGLGRLRFLGLAGNRIRSLGRKAFAGLPRLESLNLTLNPITTLEEGVFADLTHLHQLLLNSSALVCDCRLAWVARGFPHPHVQATCGFPEVLAGTSVFRVPPAHMTCDGSPRPSLVRDPPTTIALKGENVTLECQATTTAPPLTFHWRKDGRLLSSVRHPQRSWSAGSGGVWTSRLSLLGVRDGDEGRYQCVADNAHAAAYSSKARITVHVFPVFTKTPADVSIRAGSTARLECGARGQPRPAVSWRKDGGAEDFPAARERRMHVMPTDDVFFIVAARAGDAGTYSCTASNVAGTIVANATLTVLEPASFVKPMEDKEARAGETAVLECLAGGSPRPQLRWSRDGGPLRPTERHFFTAQDQLLIIVQAQPGDAGDYACDITNALGTERGTSRLRVTQASSPGLFEEGSSHSAVTTGVVVIAVVICIVGTSVIWVLIIYHTRKRAAPPPPFLDAHSVSGHSTKGGGSSAGDSGRQSSDELLAEEEGLLLTTHVRSQSVHHLDHRSHSSWGSFGRMPKDVPHDSFSVGGDQRCQSVPALAT